MSKLVVFDTNLCVWGILHESDRDNLVSRCKQLIQTLKKENYSLAIPAPVLGELMCIVPSADRPKIYESIAKVTRIYPFDVLAAEHFSEMMYQYFKNADANGLKEYAKMKKVPRQKVKIDFMIVAIAKSIGAEIIYSDDEDLRTFAKPFITAQSIPNKQYIEPKIENSQQTLFDLLDEIMLAQQAKRDL